MNAFMHGFFDELEKIAIAGKPLGRSIPKSRGVGKQWRGELATKLRKMRKMDPLWSRKRGLPALRKDLEKVSGWGDVLGEAVKKHIKPGAAASDVIERGKSRVRKALQDPELVQKGVEAATAGGGEVAQSPAAEGGKKYLKERGKGLLRGLGAKLQKMGE